MAEVATSLALANVVKLYVFINFYSGVVSLGKNVNVFDKTVPIWSDFQFMISIKNDLYFQKNMTIIYPTLV